MELRRGYDTLTEFKHNSLLEYIAELDEFIEHLKVLSKEDSKKVSGAITTHLLDLVEDSINERANVVWFDEGGFMKTEEIKFSTLPHVGTTIEISSGYYKVVGVQQSPSDNSIILAEKATALI